MKKILIKVVHIIFRARKNCNKLLKKFAVNVNNMQILEIGSGPRDECSYNKFFNSSNKFIKSDIIQKSGYLYIDVTKMDYKQKFDIIICISVLEHVYDVKEAVNNIFNALKKNGVAIIQVPCMYPLHDEPNDFWIFTEHSLRKLTNKFTKIIIKHSNIRQYPFDYYVEAYK